MKRRYELSRACSILGLKESSDLDIGLDFRLPKYRREVFLRFYTFHLENRSHPGCVYYAIPWLAQKYKLDQEQKLWLAFINGNTQNIVTSWMIFKRFPQVYATGLTAWFNANYELLEWDTDRRYHKKDFIKSVECYAKLIGSSQRKYFNQFQGGTEQNMFDRVWRALRSDFYTFGRLSSFSYSEYLRIVGLPLDCSTLFLDDLPGSKSHRNGLAKVLGRDDLDWHQNNPQFAGYEASEVSWLTEEAQTLLEDARRYTFENKRVPTGDVHYFTLESALCTYKSWHRKNRRYANVYSDMFHGRIKRAERNFGKSEVKVFWDCREDCTPPHLRLECCPNDPGLSPEKQNYYRETGKVIMMSKRWEEFENPFDQRIWRGL